MPDVSCKALKIADEENQRIKCSLVRLTKLHFVRSDSSPTLPDFCRWRGAKSATFGLDFRHHSTLDRPRFVMGKMSEI